MRESGHERKNINEGAVNWKKNHPIGEKNV